jgi:hypothetical protein
MAKHWKCIGVAKDGLQHSNQNPPGLHKPYENFGAKCVICNLKREQVIHKGSKASIKTIVIAFTAGIVIALGTDVRRGDKCCRILATS